MPLLAASQVTMHFTGPTLLERVVVEVEPGARIGMIGPNGSGKSTLLRLLAGELEPVEGRVVRQKGVTTAYQAQELRFEPGATLFAEMRKLFSDAHRREERLRALERALAAGPSPDEQRRLLGEYERLQREQETEGAYDVERRIGSLLESLGLPEPLWERPLAQFSGGERNVLGLARVLLLEPDVMLLDEPSNHLDMDGVEWFIDFAKRTPSALVTVSHNRHLLDALCTEIWELRSRKVTRWAGNYTAYRRQRAEALALQERQYKTQQRTIGRIEFQARRLMDMANAYDDPGQARRAKAMRRRIERMDKVERPDDAARRFHAKIRGGARHGRIALEVRDFSFAYGDRLLFDHASLEIEYGERVCLVGPNGSGKTTLLREVLGHGSWEDPTLRLGKSTKVGEYRQLHEEALDADATLNHWLARETGLSLSPAADLLHRFLFTRDDLERTIGTLSGGEKSRLQLARLVHDEVNFLILDEPTNHLDLEACEQLEEMLQEFDGTLLVVSHDRYFLDRLVTRVVEVMDRTLVSHPGGFGDWWRERREQRRRTALEDRRDELGVERSDKEGARRAFEERRERQREEARLRGRLRDLEKRIGEREEAKADLEARLAASWESNADPARSARLSREFDALRDELATLYREWERLAAQAGE